MSTKSLDLTDMNSLAAWTYPKFNGKQTTFFSVSQTVGALGPNNAFVSEPNLTVTTFYPEDEGLDLSSLVAGELTHPLLFY